MLHKIAKFNCVIYYVCRTEIILRKFWEDKKNILNKFSQAL